MKPVRAPPHLGAPVPATRPPLRPPPPRPSPPSRAPLPERAEMAEQPVSAPHVPAPIAAAPGDGEPSAHHDPFCRAALPPHELWPQMRYDALPELAYPARLNSAAELLDRRVAAGDGERIAIHYPGGRWTYRQLLGTANRIAHALVDDPGVVPGNRVLLRGPNTPMLAACWFAVLKAGGVAVTTMPLLRVRELTFIADKAQIRLALTDARVAGDCEHAMRTAAAGEPRTGARVVRFQGGGAGSDEAAGGGFPSGLRLGEAPGPSA